MALMTLSVFHIIVEEFYPVVFKMLFQFIGHSFILSLLKVQHFSQLDAFLFQIFCCRSAAVFGITVLLDHTLAANLLDRWPNIWLKKTLCTEEVVVESVTARWTGPAAAELAQVITLCFIISICADMLLQKSCGLFRRNLTNFSHAAMFCFERRGFLLATLANKTYLFSIC